METQGVTCPTCFEEFEVVVPTAAEASSAMEYDCEVCCRPMILNFSVEADEVFVFAQGIHD